MVADGIRGLTSNPTIFAKAVATGQYDELIRREIDAGDDARQIYEEIAVADVGDAADVLRRVYDEADGADGFASIEVEPDLAEDADATLARARELWARLERPNVFIKIPATEAGIPAIENAIAEGINVNVTLMFSVEIYKRVARAYIAGLRRRLERGEDVTRVASVALVLREPRRHEGRQGARRARHRRRPSRPAGKAAIANAKLAYEAFGEIFGGDEFADLRAAGARVQRCLWASTSTKNPDYRDVLYVEELIGPETVDTMPLETITAFLDHGEREAHARPRPRGRAPGDPRRRGQRHHHAARHRRADRRGRGQLREELRRADRARSSRSARSSPRHERPRRRDPLAAWGVDGGPRRGSPVGEGRLAVGRVRARRPRRSRAGSAGSTCPRR